MAVTVRRGFELPEERLRLYLERFVPVGDSLKCLQFSNGQSNPTYLIHSGTHKYVLRKKPPGKLLPSAHRIEREYEIQSALALAGFPVPNMLHLCTDADIVGTEFYLMDYIEGRVFTDPTLPQLQRADKAAVYEEMSRTLARLHAIDYNKIGLGSWKRKGSYSSRQFRRWSKQYEASKTSEIPQMDTLMGYLHENQPTQERISCIVHGDYRLGNIMFHPTENRILAVLDWELATLGHPFADVGYCCISYCYTKERVPQIGMKSQELEGSGIPSHKDFVSQYLRYAISNGLHDITYAHCPGDDAEWDKRYTFFLVLSIFRAAAIFQGVHKRSLQGNASGIIDGNAENIVVALASVAADIVESKESILFQLSQYESLPESLIGFASLFSPKFFDFRKRLLAFMDKYVYPNETLYHIQKQEIGKWEIPAIIEVLKEKAKNHGLWNLFIPDNELGCGLTNLEYAPLCEIMGRVIYLAPEIFNCAAPDTGNMEVLARYGTQQQKETWLKPLLSGEIRSCFGMTEPDVASSDATNIACKIKREENEYVINGRKWWTSGALDPRCKLCILMGRTSDSGPKYRQQSMIIVPLDTPGFKILRHLTVFGYDDAPHGHAECRLENVRVPISNMILGEGRGFEIAQGRLGPGRIHHCMRCIGVAEVALELMCKRAFQRSAFGSKFSEKDIIISEISKCRMEIEQARLLTLQAAHMMDRKGNKFARQYISMIKVVAPQMAINVIDRAIQIHGGAGVSQDFPLAFLLAQLRTLRLADGPDEVHRRTIGRIELSKCKL